ncbi:NAD-dependent epimerase/dehydratase family protein [Streptomyces sp. NPDC058420]|uniref:NAD-dependent epimerase/dehydratase family protein n=1 Tax=Streptomyces sp. NPDC058420 TaxID=3346489 RepID=UPI0036512823
MHTVLITGAAGFIGSHVAHEAARRGVTLTLLSHRRPVLPLGPSHRIVSADLTEPDSVHGVCEGVDTVLHCASYVGSASEANEAVNARGTMHLVAEARRSGVSRIVYVSTASVYGRGIFRGARPGQLVRNPGSPTSASRAAAEDTVLDAGGIVLRPHLVHGAGDLWMVPGLVRLLRTLPGGVEDWSALLSVVSVRDLARLVVSTGLAPRRDLTSTTYHATHPVPVTAETLLRAAAACASLPWPRQNVSVTRARAFLAADRQASHALSMLSTDHWFDGLQLWRDLGLTPGPDFRADFAESANWYRCALLTA